ncbi:hypothetical protein ALC57_06319 [Trachymyrmex cornetzi]|uniref:Uncharacterized protein n=1 Tax=Trachymyrmex cornetzi TaxID=471704 RepID=A0A195E863_9HYME|nr:hypothetical protein ALC57_06319 [Trachymyrmex cornetzi]
MIQKTRAPGNIPKRFPGPSLQNAGARNARSKWGLMANNKRRCLACLPTMKSVAWRIRVPDDATARFLDDTRRIGVARRGARGPGPGPGPHRHGGVQTYSFLFHWVLLLPGEMAVTLRCEIRHAGRDHHQTYRALKIIPATSARFRYYQSLQDNAGLNTGVSAALGEAITFYDRANIVPVTQSGRASQLSDRQFRREEAVPRCRRSIDEALTVWLHMWSRTEDRLGGREEPSNKNVNCTAR